MDRDRLMYNCTCRDHTPVHKHKGTPYQLLVCTGQGTAIGCFEVGDTSSAGVDFGYRVPYLSGAAWAADFFKFDNDLINATLSSDAALGFSTGAPTKTPSMYSLDDLTEAQSPSPTTNILPVSTNAPFLFSDESDENTDAPTMIPDSRTIAQPTLSLDPLQIEPTVIINNTQQTLAASTADARSSYRDTKLTFLPTLVVTLYPAFLLAK
jgi:hypothetical protein